MVKVVVALGAMLATANAGTITESPESVLKKIDTTVDPCQDFYEYACGSWYKNQTVVDSSYDMTTVIRRDTVDVVVKVLQSNEPKISAFYKSCMDTDTLEKLGVSPLSKSLSAIRDAKTKRDLLDITAGLLKHKLPLFALVIVKGDDRDATTNTLFALQSALPLTNAENYLDDNLWSNVEVDYKHYITTVLKLAGHSQQDASDAAVKIIKFEKALARSMLSTLEMKNAQASREDYYPFSLYDAAKRFPSTVGPLLLSFDLNTTYPEPITPKSRIVFSNLSYFDKTEVLINATSLDDLKTVVEYRLLQVSAPYLSSDFEKAHLAFFEQKLKGVTSLPTRAVKCTIDAMENLGDLLGSYYLKQRWSTAQSTKVMEILDGLVASVKSSIEKTEWLDGWTRTNALTKLAKIDYQVGGPGTPELYDDVDFDADAYLVNSWRMFKSSLEGNIR
ncbi:hypothetical protein AeRB84_012619 [Aphanomyces euteiches]|nr:hypothetical protein AeRB84_012619 [Aphanomyces euteiches]